MQYREQITQLAQMSPLLPSNVAKALNTNSIMAGAMLSEMCDKGLLKTSALRVGGSPLYYLPGKEDQLLNHLSSLNEKDRRTVTLLRDERIIRESDADPLTRVSLAQVKDFAKPLTVAYADKQETFWKWFMLTDSEAEELIRKKLESTPAPSSIEHAQTPAPTTEPVSAPSEPTLPSKTRKRQTQQKLTTTQPKEKIPPTEPPPAAELSGDFWNKITTFFSSSAIVLNSHTILKKKTDFDLIVEIPSPVGTLSYYCKARSKKKITDADISQAYVQGQLHKLPTLFITDGELSPQAKTVLSQLKGITVKQV